MLKIILSGILGGDAEVREVGQKKAINFSVAVSMDYKDADGNKVEKTEWVKAVIWKNESSNSKVNDYLKKGQRVLIEGVPSSDGYIGKDGTAHSSLQVVVKDLEFLN